ncbi:thioredoxin [Anaerofustis stercorihominis]|uniref:Thioredoxin n=2 Tax=Anaerofustis stercorihominis TaxID=214853 RepID=B1CBR5_9FIRM|nr:thioredoxin [Anaerofustis stercorihominis]EDS71712.1 thioredoxin [Anaerofustis stercorihominis DSM 17244]MCQ4796231.1 thioredoxin [Anaerofustis stercorihominis]RGD75218.1 thioredoxin [Anaerofustis stercorihominis]
MSVIDLTNKTFKEEINDNRLVIVDFWAPWCGPCSAFSPVIDEVSEERNDIKVCKVNVDDERMLAMKNKVMSIPTLLMYKDGKQVKRTQGAMTKQELLEVIDQVQ